MGPRLSARLRRFRHSQLSRLNLAVLDEDDENDKVLNSNPEMQSRPAICSLPTPNVNPFTDQSVGGDAPSSSIATQVLVPAATPTDRLDTTRLFASPPAVQLTTPRIDSSTPTVPSFSRSHGIPAKKMQPSNAGLDSHSQLQPTIVSASGQVSRYLHDYEQLGIIASGHFGSVTRCRQRVDGMEYAIKRLPANSRRPGHAKNTEIFALAALETCAHVVRYFQSWVEDASIYIQLELCETYV